VRALAGITGEPARVPAGDGRRPALARHAADPALIGARDVIVAAPAGTPDDHTRKPG